MNKASDNNLKMNVVLSEFNVLREEIKNRSSTAFTLLNINITATATVAGLVLSEKVDLNFLLIIPLLSPALGLLFIDHSFNITNLGNYINTQLRPLIIEMTGDSRLLGYENFVDEYEKNKFLRFMPLGFPLLLLFIGFPCATLVISVCVINNLLGYLVWGLGVLMVVIYIILWINFIIAPYQKQSKSEIHDAENT